MKTYIADTADITFRRRSDKKVIFTAEAQMASIKQSIQEEKVKGGIGNRTLFTLKNDKEVELSARNALFDNEWMEMAQGVSFKKGTAVVTSKEDGLTVVKGEVTIKGTPLNNEVYLINEKGEMSSILTLTTGKVTVPALFASDNENVTAIYKKEVQGDVLTIAADKFPETYEVEYHTIEYNPATNQVVKDIYFQFDNVSPNGSMDLSFENGNAIAPEMTFTAMTAPNSSVIGRVVEVDRV